jgi:uncharacterized protein
MTAADDRLRACVRDCPWLMRALAAARAVGPPDWVVGAGAVRDLVFEHLHGRVAGPPRDLDLAYFDPGDLSPAGEQAVAAAVAARCPELPFDVRNQARVHLWYESEFGHPIEPYRSIEHAVSTWPETATAVGVRLLADDGIAVIAPFGLDDLFAGVLRRNPAQVTPAIFRARLARRPDLAERWPLVQVVDG